MGSALENVNFLWENKMVGRGGRDRSSSAVEILTLNFFIHCLQHYDAGFRPKIRAADGKPSSEFYIVQGWLGRGLAPYSAGSAYPLLPVSSGSASRAKP